MICVLDILQGPAAGKRIWLRENQCIEVGRTSATDFSIPTDTHLSRRHFLLDSTGDGFRIRDIGSSNGTFLNNAKISVSELRSGDMIRAGLTTMSVTFRENDANPHASDHVAFSPVACNPTDFEDTNTTRRSIGFPKIQR